MLLTGYRVARKNRKNRKNQNPQKFRATRYWLTNIERNFRNGFYTSFGHLGNNGIKYILRYIYSLKSYVVNLQRKWVLANQSSGRRFSLVKKKNKKTKTKKQQQQKKTIRPIRIAYDYFLSVREMMRLTRSHSGCVSFAPKVPPFIGACGLQRLCLEVTSQIFKENICEVLLLGKWEASRKLEWIVSYISLTMNSGRGKKRMRRKLKFYIFVGVILFSV